MTDEKIDMVANSQALEEEFNLAALAGRNRFGYPLLLLSSLETNCTWFVDVSSHPRNVPLNGTYHFILQGAGGGGNSGTNSGGGGGEAHLVVGLNLTEGEFVEVCSNTQVKVSVGKGGPSQTDGESTWVKVKNVVYTASGGKGAGSNYGGAGGRSLGRGRNYRRWQQRTLQLCSPPASKPLF